MDAADLDAIDELARRIHDAARVVVLTGAGVSTGSGIPDFRGPQGLWTTQPALERLFSLDAYLTDPDVRRRVWQLRLENPVFTASPSPAHLALVELERLDRLHTLITQNVDGLHQAAGSDPDRVVEVHGTIHEVVCLSCERRVPTSEVLEEVSAGDPDPACRECGGLQKTATISFGQSLDPAQLQRAHDAAMGADVFLAVGSSLVVHPVALLPRTALERGAHLAVVNAQPTPYDTNAHSIVRQDAGEVLETLAARVRDLSA